jgi:Fic-DOC domain mobile mystery protein B
MVKYFDFPIGATPIDDCSGLKIDWVQNRIDLNRVEAENILKAQEKYLRGNVDSVQNWFSIDRLKKIHEKMFGDVWTWAGAFRQSVTSIGISPALILMQLSLFCHEVISWMQFPTELTFLEMAARIHHRLVFIHPFENGNGRFSRLIADRFLLSLKCSCPNWHIDLQDNSYARKRYIEALKEADLGNYAKLIAYMKKCNAKDPTLKELLEMPLYRKSVQKKQLLALIKASLRMGAKVNEIEKGSSVLHKSIKLGLEEISEVLIKRGANMYQKEKSGLSSFELAILYKQFRIAKMIIDNGYSYIPQMLSIPKLTEHLEEFDQIYF